MLAVPVARSSGKDCDDYVGPERAHHSHYVVEQRILWPVREGFVSALRESKIIGTSEILVRAVHSSSREKLLSADDAKRLAQLVADQILAAVTAGNGEIGRICMTTALEPRYQLSV